MCPWGQVHHNTLLQHSHNRRIGVRTAARESVTGNTSNLTQHCSFTDEEATNLVFSAFPDSNSHLREGDIAYTFRCSRSRHNQSDAEDHQYYYGYVFFRQRVWMLDMGCGNSLEAGSTERAWLLAEVCGADQPASLS